MTGSSPLRNGLTLAQRFAFKPSEGKAAASGIGGSASKRRKIDGDGSASDTRGALSTSESTSAGLSPTAEARSSGAVKEAVSGVGAASDFGASSGAALSDIAKGKKRALSPGADDTPAIPERDSSSQAASAFAKSLSDAELAGVGGKLSERQLLELECNTLHPSWLEPLQKELRSPYFLKLKRFLWTEGVKNHLEASKTIFPPAKEIYAWSKYTPLQNVRIVILGQDPYHNDGQAHGLAFSVRSNVKAPPSLKNIYKEIKTDYPDFVTPPHGYLASWAKQGVLLLNTSLTVRAHAANSHSKKGWEEFTDAVLRVVDKRPGPGVVFLAWGQPAQKRMAGIDKKKHLILSSAHPSPLSASRGFFGNAHFKKANAWLGERYGQEGRIDWCTLEANDATAPKGELSVDVANE